MRNTTTEVILNILYAYMIYAYYCYTQELRCVDILCYFEILSECLNYPKCLKIESSIVNIK